MRAVPVMQWIRKSNLIRGTKARRFGGWQPLRAASLSMLLGLAACSGGSDDSAAPQVLTADPVVEKSNSNPASPDDIQRLLDTAGSNESVKGEVPVRQKLIIDYAGILEAFENANDPADDSIVVRWNPPTRRQNRAPLAERDILGYVLVMFRESDLAGGILGGRIGSVEEFRERDEQIQRLIPPHEIMNAAMQDSRHLRMISSGGAGLESFEDLAPGRYHLAMSTIDWQGMAGEFSQTLSKTIR